MSNTKMRTDVERAAAAASMPEAKRGVLNPFDGPATWLDFANELARGYMEDELEEDDYHQLSSAHHEWLSKFGHGNCVLLCHRDGLKTTITLAYLIANLEYRPGFKAVWAMNNQGQVIKKADTEFWRMVERNEWLQVLNSRPERDTVTAKEFQNNASLYSGWLNGGIEGDRAHLLVLDDLIKQKGDGSTDDVMDWIESACVPMVKDRGRTVVIGTRKRRDDIYNRYRDRPGFDIVEFPAILDVWDAEHRNEDDHEDRRPSEEHYTEVDDPFGEGTVRMLWPEARGPDWLAQKRSEMSDYNFWREYCMVFRGGEGSLIEAGDIDLDASEGGCSIRGESPPHRLTASEGQMVVVGHDPAQSPTGDLAAFVAMLVSEDGVRRVLDARAERGMSPSRVKSTLAGLDERYDPATVVIEDNGMQQYVVNDAIEFSASLRAKVTGVSTSGRKHSWENGIPKLRSLVEGGDIEFYRGHDGTEGLIEAMLSLDLDDGRLTGHTPDLVAAWYMAEKGIEHSAAGITKSDHSLGAMF